MKKMLAAVAVLVAAICALTVVNFAYDTNPEVAAMGETANAAVSAETDVYSIDRQKSPVGLNAENQYDILADNHLYGHCDYGDYVPAETRYVDGFPEVDGVKTYNRYYGEEGYIKPAEEEKPEEDWNLHDFHKHGQLFESIGSGEMYFRNDEDREAFIDSLKEEFGAGNVREINLETATGSNPSSAQTDKTPSGNTADDSKSSDSFIDYAKDTVDNVNERQNAVNDAAN